MIQILRRPLERPAKAVEMSIQLQNLTTTKEQRAKRRRKPMDKSKLTSKQRIFVEAYQGNATEAALAAGYSAKNAFKIGSELLQKSTIAKAIRSRETKRIKPLIANRQRRQQFWSSVMEDEEQPMKERLKASELLGKSEGDFLDRHEYAGKDGGPLVVNITRFSDMPEAEPEENIGEIKSGNE